VLRLAGREKRHPYARSARCPGQEVAAKPSIAELSESHIANRYSVPLLIVVVSDLDGGVDQSFRPAVGTCGRDVDRPCCCDLCRAAGDEHTLEFALLHADIIRRFGRFPDRNAVLGRVTTPEEQAFLDGGGFAG
jgi:hypothetical protein